MNRTKIEWCDYTWNPVTGCLHNCPYCYARKIAKRFKGSKAWPNGFEPTFHPERLKELRKLGTQHYCMACLAERSTIFVCSMADLFGDWVPDSWITEVFQSCMSASRHTYIFLTKNPERYLRISETFLKRENFWFGMTIDGTEGDSAILSKYKTFQKVPSDNLFLNFEPLLGGIPERMHFDRMKGVIVGAQTNPFNPPAWVWLFEINSEAMSCKIPLFVKNNLKDAFPEVLKSTYWKRELPWPVRKEVPE